MTSKWPIARIADCAASEPYSTQIGPFGDKIKATSYVAKGAPVLRGTNLSRHARFHDTDFVYVREELVSTEFAKFICEAGDVILCHKGTLGEIGIIPRQTKHSKYVMGNSMMKVRCNLDILEPLYLYYWLSSKDGQDYLFSRVSQVGVPQIQTPLTTLRQAEFPLPPLIEQKRIASILGSLDDKIELNRKMNETLEQMTKALFKSWFVDFDPVHAKAARSKPTGMDKATNDLFPDSFVDSELGKIPKGWRVGTISEIATNPRRGIQPGDIAPGTPYIALEHMPRRSIALGDWADSNVVESGKTVFKKGDILFGKLRPYFHKVGLAQVDGVCSTDILVLSPISESWRGSLLCIASSDELIQFTNLASTGTKMPRTNWGDIGSFKIVIPCNEVAKEFTKRTTSLTDKIGQNLIESKVLTETRNLLLPKLLSHGE
jgi:type I restriction enzyme S subunit